MKSGIMEIGDIFIVNKADKDGADRLVTEINMMLELSPSPREWTPPVIKTIATENYNINIMGEKIKEHKAFLVESGMLASRRKERIRSEITKIVEHEIFKYFGSLIAENRDMFEKRLEDIVNKKEDPYLLAKQAVGNIAKRINDERHVLVDSFFQH